MVLVAFVDQLMGAGDEGEVVYVVELNSTLAHAFERPMDA